MNAEQQGIINYLSQRIDPYDFQFAIKEWAIEADEPDRAFDEVQADDLNDRQRRDFIEWASKRHDQWVEELGPHAPSYLFFEHAKAVPAGTWLVHRTNAEPFRSFKYGALLWELGLTRHFSDTKRTESVAECDVPADARQPLYGFAFRADDRTWRWAERKYGRNAVFFQHDSAVSAYHIGDDEQQVIFDICGVYNAIPVRNADPLGGGDVLTDEGSRHFETWEDIIAWASRGQKPKKSRKALAGLAQAGRWNAHVRFPKLGMLHGVL